MKPKLLPTNKLRWHRRTVRGSDKKGNLKTYDKVFLQQFWISPFVEGGNGVWHDVPVKGAWDKEEDEETK